MFHKLHLQLTVFCTVVTGAIFLVLAAFCLFFAEKGLRGNEYSSFLRQLNSVLVHLQEQEVISHQWLSRLQKDSQVIFFLYDNGKPLYYQSYHNTDREYELEQEAIEKACKEHQMDIFSVSAQQVISHTEFDFASSAGDRYFASAGVIPRKDKQMSFVILFSLEKYQAQVVRLRLTVCAAGLAAVLLLLVFSWFFTKRMIMPLEDARRKQMYFIASASHELRTPLSVVRTGLEAVKKADDAEQREHFMGYMDEEIVRMQNLIRDMLLLANADSGHLPVHMALCQPEELLVNIYEKYESIAGKKNITLSVALPEEWQPQCRYDREKMIQVFSVLVDNALSYTPAGGSVLLSLRQEGGRLRFSVSDTGCGIREEDRERIFDRFYRSDDAHTDRMHFGLGLCIAKEIVEEHQGKIWVEGSAEGGSSFYVSLPIYN